MDTDKIILDLTAQNFNVTDSGIKIYQTKDYDIFQKLPGNRSVMPSVKKIQDSIKKIGIVTNPVIVNDKMQVIDGQNRIEAFKREDKPVYFIIEPGLGIEECRSLNNGQVNWNNMNYIESFADVDKNDNYIWLLHVSKKFPRISTDYIASFCLSGFTTMSYSKTSEIIKNGEFELDAAKRNEAEQILAYCHQFSEMIKKVKGRTFYFYDSIVFCYKHPSIDADMVAKKLLKNSSKMNTKANKDDYIAEIDRVYNLNIKNADNRIAIKGLWELAKLEARKNSIHVD